MPHCPAAGPAAAGGWSLFVCTPAQASPGKEVQHGPSIRRALHDLWRFWTKCTECPFEVTNSVHCCFSTLTSQNQENQANTNRPKLCPPRRTMESSYGSFASNNQFTLPCFRSQSQATPDIHLYRSDSGSTFGEQASRAAAGNSAEMPVLEVPAAGGGGGQRGSAASSCLRRSSCVVLERGSGGSNFLTNSFNGAVGGGALGSFSFLAAGGGGGSGGRGAARGGGGNGAAPPPSSGSFAAPRSQSGLLLHLLDSRANDLHAQLPPPLWDDETNMLVLKVRLCRLGLASRAGRGLGQGR